MMSIQTLETTELIREVNQVISDGCKLTLEGDADTDRKTEKQDKARRQSELW
jgi:hypothetical protein